MKTNIGLSIFMKRTLFLLIVCLTLALTLFAQTRTTQPIDPKRESPRATLTTFINAFKQPRVGVTPDPIEEAVKCLDLREIPEEYRQVKGFELASQLLEIIESVENFHLEDVPSTTAGVSYSLFRSQTGEVLIARQPNGEWLFAQETVRAAPLLMVAVDNERNNYGSATLTQADSVGAQIRGWVPNSLKKRTLGLERWQWLGLCILLVLGILVGTVVKTVVTWLLGKILRRRYEALTDEDLKILNAPLGLLAFVIIFRAGLRALALTQGSIGFLRTVMFLLTAFAIIWLIYRLVNTVAARLQAKALETESQADDLLVPFVSVIVRIGVVLVGLIIVAENLDFNVAGLIAGLGIGGIAIALASQETLSNFFGSLVLMIERPFMADDRVTVGGVQGTVKEVGIRSTKIQTFDDSIVTVPNSNVVKNNIVNDGLRHHRNWVVKFSVPYQNGADKIEGFCKSIEDIIKQSKFLDNKEFNLHIFDVTPPTVVIRVEINFAEDAFEFELNARQQFIMDVLRLADKSEIELKASK